MLVTEPSSKTSWIARASSGAIGRIVSDGEALRVRDRHRVGDDDLIDRRRTAAAAVAGSLKIACVAATMTRSAPFFLSASAALTIVPPVSIMSSTSRQTRPFDLADDLVHRDLVRDVRVATLVDDRQRRTEAVGPGVGDAHAADVGRDDGELCAVLGRQRALEVLQQHGLGEQVVDGTVEEALDLRGVQVDAHDAVGTGGLEQVGDETRADRLATAALLVLTGVRVVGRDDGDALGGCPLGGIEHDQRLHEPLVDRRPEATG